MLLSQLTNDESDCISHLCVIIAHRFFSIIIYFEFNLIHKLHHLGIPYIPLFFV